MAEIIDTNPRNYTVRDFTKARLVIQDTINYVTPNGEVTQDHTNFTHWLENQSEQPYNRRMIAVEQWEKIPIGWAGEWGSCSMVYIENIREPRQVRPTPEEQAAEDAKIIEVHFGPASHGGFSADDSIFVIPPGESLRGQPKKFDQIYIRCLSGFARYTISIYPG
jgi:hypothetical protein